MFQINVYITMCWKVDIELAALLIEFTLWIFASENIYWEGKSRAVVSYSQELNWYLIDILFPTNKISLFLFSITAVISSANAAVKLSKEKMYWTKRVKLWCRVPLFRVSWVIILTFFENKQNERHTNNLMRCSWMQHSNIWHSKLFTNS